MEFTVQQLQIMQSQMTTILQEKDNVKEFYCQSQRSMKDLSAEVVGLNSDKIEKEQDYEARLKELEIKIQEKDDASAASVISWNNEKEVTFERQLGSLRICFSLSKSCVIRTIHHGILQKIYFCQDLCRNSVVYSILVFHMNAHFLVLPIWFIT
jgi:hypothetical protein